jgi:hypothetical protein
MKIEISKPYLRVLVKYIRPFKLRHGPFNKYLNQYTIYLYPSNKNTLLLIAMSDTDLKEIH